MWHKIIVVITILQQASAQFLPGLYCGEDDCYKILNVTRDSSKNEISRNYRGLAKQYHPDNRLSGDEQMFKKIANAYEILKDDESKKDYDYMLDNPQAYYQHYYR